MKSFEDIQKMENELVKDAQKNISKDILIRMFKIGGNFQMDSTYSRIRRMTAIKKIFMTYERN